MSNQAVIVNCNNIMSLPVIRLLGKDKIPVTGFFGKSIHEQPFQNIIKVSKYLNEIKFFNEDNYSENLISALIDYARRNKEKPVLFLASDTDLLTISENREKLEKFYLFTLPEKETLKKILNKEQFIDLAKELHLPVPKSLKLSDLSSIDLITKELRYPFIIKPSWRDNNWLHKFKERKVFQINNVDELLSTIKVLKNLKYNYLVQEIIPGPEENIVCSFAVLDENSDIIDIGLAKKITQYPPDFGNTSIAQPIFDTKIKNLCADIFKALKLKGFANIEFKYDSRDGEYKIIEVTPNRFNRQFAVTAISGHNLPLQLYKFEINAPRVVSKEIINYRLWISEINEVRRISLYSKNRFKQIIIFFKRIFRTKIFEIFDLHDLRPFFQLIKYSLTFGN